MPDNSDTGTRIELDEYKYIDGNPFSLLFSDQEAMSALFDLKQIGPAHAGIFAARRKNGTVTSDEVDHTKELLEFLYDIDLLLKDNPSSAPTYELNQAHELNKALEAPHMRRLTGDDVVAGLLDCYLGHRYLSCLSPERLTGLTGFSQEQVEAGNEKLSRLRVIRDSMALEGEIASESAVDRADTLLQTVSDLIDAADDEGLDLDAKALRDILNGRPKDGDERREELFVLTGDELRNAVQLHATMGYPEIDAATHASTVDGGKTGYTLNQTHEAADNLYEAHMRLIDHTQTIQSWYADQLVDDNTSEGEETDGPLFTYRPTAEDPSELVEKLEDLINTYFDDAGEFAEQTVGTVLVHLTTEDEGLRAELKDAADRTLPDGYTATLESVEGSETERSAVPDNATVKLRVVRD